MSTRSFAVQSQVEAVRTVSLAPGETMAAASQPVPFVDLKAAHNEVADEVGKEIADVMAAAAFIKGPAVAAFEEEFAAFCGASHCIGVGNGTDAIELALRAADIPAGSEVILPANTFVATAEAVLRAGARPVFADVDQDHLLLDPASAERAIGAGTTAVIPVHLFGQLAPMKLLTEIAAARGLMVIEDAAQCHGASQGGSPAGTHGLAAATSFYPGKNLGAYGDAGAIVTNSPPLARNARLLGDHGSDRKYLHERLGFNSRLDSIQAAVLRVKLRRLAGWNDRRRAAADRYHDLLSDLDDVVLPRTGPGNEHVWHLYVVQVPRRDKVARTMQELGVHVGIHYPVPIHLQAAFRRYGYGPGDFPVAEAAAERILSLPLYPQITPAQQERVADALRHALRAPAA